MKKIFFFASAMVAALTMNAQTITVDGSDADWASVPMVTEPGSPRVLKFLLSNQTNANVGTGNAFAVMFRDTVPVDGSKTFCIFVDADKSTTTGNDVWFCKGMAKDYEMTQWVSGNSYTASGNVGEMSVASSAFENIAYSGSFYGWLSFDWGKFYVPNSPEPSGDNWLWSETKYQVLDVRPFEFVDMNGTHLFKNTWSRHQCVALADSMNFNVSGGAQDTAFWCAWTVEIAPNAKYKVSADIVSPNGASCDLYLVDIPTNKVVATLQSAWLDKPQGATDLGEWDLSAIPAGKYMLKMKNHIDFSEMKFYSVTMDGPALPTGFNPAATVAAPAKMIKNGRFMINNNGKYINAMGF